MFQQVLGAVAQVLSMPSDVLHGLAITASDGVADFFPAVGRKQQRDPGANSDAGDQKGEVTHPSGVFGSCCRAFVLPVSSHIPLVKKHFCTVSASVALP